MKRWWPYLKEGKFPAADNLTCGELIKRCGHSKISSAEEIHVSTKLRCGSIRLVSFSWTNSTSKKKLSNALHQPCL
jgi:hypothetical protein